MDALTILHAFACWKSALEPGFDSPQGPPKGLAHWFELEARGKTSGQPREKLSSGKLTQVAKIQGLHLLFFCLLLSILGAARKREVCQPILVNDGQPCDGPVCFTSARIVVSVLSAWENISEVYSLRNLFEVGNVILAYINLWRAGASAEQENMAGPFQSGLDGGETNHLLAFLCLEKEFVTSSGLPLEIGWC